MNARTNLALSLVPLLVVLAFSSPAAAVNLITDPGFESNPLDTAANVLSNFPVYQGVWGPEMSTITGPDLGITPYQGSKMLKMTDDGLTTTQAFQTIDVSSYSGLINSGSAIVNFSAFFNPDKDLPAAIAAVYVSFFTSNNYGSLTSTLGASLTLDISPNTWEPISMSTPIPTGTTWVMAQVAYNNASLNLSDGAVHGGYVDAANLEIRSVPEPGTIMLLLTGLVGCVYFYRRRSK